MADRVRTEAEIRRTRINLDDCLVCDQRIQLMCRKGTGICSENCEKEHKSASE
jgi:hypothetical protein